MNTKSDKLKTHQTESQSTSH